MGNLCALFSLHPPSILTCPHPVITPLNLMLSFSNLIPLIAPLPSPSPHLHPSPHLTPSPHLSPPYLTSHPLTSLSSTSLHLQANSTYPKFSPGYLSLHNQQRGGGLELKWIPIDLLNCNQEDPEAEPAIRCTTLTHGGVTSMPVLCVCRAWLPALFRPLATLHTCFLAMYQL